MPSPEQEHTAADTAGSFRVRRRFPCDPSSAASVRSFVASAVAGRDVDVDAIRLLVSELAAAARCERDGTFVVRVTDIPDGVRVQVSDSVGDVSDLASMQYGPTLFQRLAHRWGLESYEEGKTVWFEVVRNREPTEQGQDDSENSPTYSIGAVSEIVGVETSTLRMWERRYGVVTPQRSGGGQRLYTRKQVDLLRFVVARIREGMRPADAHRMLERHDAAAPVPPVDADTSTLVLLAERVPQAADLVGFFLRTEGFSVLVALDAHDARRLVERRLPDIAVVEMLLPGSGVALCKDLSNLGVKVVAVSPLALRDVAADAGAAAFLSKPFDPLDLVSTVRDLLGTSALARSARTTHAETEADAR